MIATYYENRDVLIPFASIQFVKCATGRVAFCDRCYDFLTGSDFDRLLSSYKTWLMAQQPPQPSNPIQFI